MRNLLKRLSPGQIIALGFILMILVGSGLLMLPCSIQPGQQIHYIDALYAATSAVCVTGLVTIDPGTAFTPIGHFFLGLLIQIGGLGLTTIGAGMILAVGKKLDLKSRNIIQASGNLTSGGGTIHFLKQVLFTTLTFELAGAALSFIVFIRDYPLPQALGYSLFHSVSAFNNAGFDILGHSGELYANTNLLAYHDDVLLNAVTIGLIIFGGIGFLVIREISQHKLHWKKYSMHAKVVITTSLALTLIGTVLIKLTQSSESWLGALFHSVATRTAGFSTTNIGSYTSAGLLVMIVLMVIGASPGSTGGGIKTTTFFVLLQGILSAATNRSEKAFHFSIPSEMFRKAAVITVMALGIILTGTFLLLVMDPQVAFIDALFEICSACSTAGLSTGITSGLSLGSKLLCIAVMYIGRLGPLSIATLWYFNKGERVRYPNGNIAIG